MIFDAQHHSREGVKGLLFAVSPYELMDANASPVIIYGMHRSGTTLVTKVLEALGLFVGFRKDTNQEAQFFLQLNDWMMLQAGAAWDQPEPIGAMLQDGELKRALREYAWDLMHSGRSISYLGVGKYLRYRNVSALSIPWGWKDPRNTFVLPIWSDLFPNARYIHVKRHGCDVAHSLKTRSDQLKPKLAFFLNRRYPKFLPFPPRRRPVARQISARLNTYAGAFSLWSEYMLQAQQMESQHHGNSLSIRYEDFLERPLEFLPELASFAGLPSSTLEEHERIASTIKASRAYAYRGSEELLKLATENEETLSRFGY